MTYNLVGEIPSGEPEDFYAEYDNRGTISAIKKALQLKGHTVLLIEADENAFEKIKLHRPDIIFNIAEGIRGESRESYVPLICEKLEIPYTGSGPLTLALCLNKARSHETLLHHKIPTPRFQVVTSRQEDFKLEIDYPIIVKPVSEGSSKGIHPDSVVENEDDLYKKISCINFIYNQPAIVEEFLPGPEFTVGILGNENAYALPVIEIYLNRYRRSKNIYCFESKTKWELDSKSGQPRVIYKELQDEIIQIALKSHRIMDCKDMSRIDIRLDTENVPHVIDVNPLPGLNPNLTAVSYLPKAARMAGMSYNELIHRIFSYALKRYSLKEEDAIECCVSL